MGAPTCPHCGAAVQPNAESCPACGKAGVPQYAPDPVAGEDGVFYCYRHKRETTRLRCGRCGRAICTSCAIIGPAGPRCPECGRNKVPVRARAVAHEAKASLRSLFTGPFRYFWMIFLFGTLMTVVTSCFNMLRGFGGPGSDPGPAMERPKESEP